ncbi:MULTISPECIES: hypothetical protein [Streptomyces]|uniref:Uncharacterized protein n=1 Tax=Streptomyces typhae TaxID=2681492 RepID=A0A6L6XA61_9ACTN|nr:MULTISPECIES: hypothetical protein [Streptomyces]MVO90587.1 hypothetical protein [Streptomyces typhae]
MDDIEGEPAGILDRWVVDLFEYCLAVVDDALPTSADDAASSGGIRRFQQGAHRLRPGHPHERYALVDQELFQVIRVWRDVAQVLRVEPVDDVAEGGEDAVPLGRPVGRAQRLQGLADHVVEARQVCHLPAEALRHGVHPDQRRIQHDSWKNRPHPHRSGLSKNLADPRVLLPHVVLQRVERRRVEVREINRSRHARFFGLAELLVLSLVRILALVRLPILTHGHMLPRFHARSAGILSCKASQPGRHAVLQGEGFAASSGYGRPSAGAARRARPPRNLAERAPTLGRVCGTVATSIRAWAYKEGQDNELLNGCGQGNLLWRLHQRESFCATCMITAAG